MIRSIPDETPKASFLRTSVMGKSRKWGGRLIGVMIEKEWEDKERVNQEREEDREGDKLDEEARPNTRLP